jgi:hypothetical protein
MSFGYVVPLHRPTHQNELMCPLRNGAPMNSCTRQPSRPLGSTHPKLGYAHRANVTQLIWCAPCFTFFLGKSPWRVCAPKATTCPTSATLRCWSNPKFYLLEDLGEGVHSLLVEDLTRGNLNFSFGSSKIWGPMV